MLGEKLICFTKYGRCKISQNKEKATFSISRIQSESDAKYSFRHPLHIIYQTRCSWGCSTNTFVIYSVCHPFVQRSSNHLHSQTVGARHQLFLEIVHLPPHVICNVSSVTCHISLDTCIFCWGWGGQSG